VKPKLASGYDGIIAKLMRESAQYISSPLTYICNKSVYRNIFFWLKIL
jgi:hypothetical protein